MDTTKEDVIARSRIADPSLADEGNLAIEWAREHAPVLDNLVRDTLSDGSFTDRRVALVVHLEAKTAFLATVLADAGAEVVVAGSNPHSTRDEIAAALVSRGIEVHSCRGDSYERWEQDLLAVADTEPEYIIDDGAELTVRMARHRPEAYARLQGVSEQTTTGVARLRALLEAGQLPFPTMAANDAHCKHMFDNRYGTGQSTLQAILDLTNLLMAGKQVAIIGYGWVGRGIATYVKGFGGRAMVLEVDPIRALEAHMDGHVVDSYDKVLPQADFVITATGGARAIGDRHFAALKPNAILANAGHHDLEIDVEALADQAASITHPRAGVTRYDWNGKALNVLASGALVNIAGGLGHPVEIMDLSFAVQGLSTHELVTGDHPAGVHVLALELDQQIARSCLAARGITLDEVTDDQADTVGREILDRT